MAKRRFVNPTDEQTLLAPLASLRVGVTEAFPGAFPDGFAQVGIGKRSAPRNEYLGFVATRPTADRYVIGLNYFDQSDNDDNEDLYMFDTAAHEIELYEPRRFERQYPQYAGYHRADACRTDPPRRSSDRSAP
jgi:hypothetical protein